MHTMEKDNNNYLNEKTHKCQLPENYNEFSFSHLIGNLVRDYSDALDRRSKIPANSREGKHYGFLNKASVKKCISRYELSDSSLVGFLERLVREGYEELIFMEERNGKEVPVIRSNYSLGIGALIIINKLTKEAIQMLYPGKDYFTRTKFINNIINILPHSTHEELSCFWDLNDLVSKNSDDIF